MRFAAHFLFMYALLASAPAPAAVPVALLRQVVTGFSLPVEIAHANDSSNRLFVVEQGGRIRIVQNGAVLATPFLDISSGVISAGGERGLLGLAFHPNYATNGAFYVFYTRTGDGALVVARVLRSAANPNVADAMSRTEILAISHSENSNHNGGHIAFGPDGFLYIGTGDGGGGGDPLRAALNPVTRLGKLLRISVDGGTSYSIPPSNPYAGQTCTIACPEIWAYGLRNPWKFSFDRVSGDLLLGDVGQGSWEEVDWVPRGTPGPINFGWGAFEGNICYNNNYFGTAGACAAQTNHRVPVVTYDHGSSGGASITGGYRYRGVRHAELEGHYLFGDYGSRRIWAARRNADDTWTTELLIDQANSVTALSSFGEDEAGELYVLDYGNGRLMALDGPALSLTSAVSRVEHAQVGFLDIPISRGKLFPENYTVEPRTQGHPSSVVLQFSGTVSSAAVVRQRNASGEIVGTLPFFIDGSNLSVQLPAFLTPALWLFEVEGLNGTGGSIALAWASLPGDVGGTGRVTAADIATIKQRIGAQVTTANARFDLNRDGKIDQMDVGIAKSRSGLAMP